MKLKNDLYELEINMVMQNEDINDAYVLVEKNGGELIELDNVLDTNQWRLYSIKTNDGINEEILYLLGSPYSALDNCFILEDDKLKVLNDNYLIDIDLESLEIIDKLEVLDYSTGIQIVPYIDGCLIHGERELLRLDENNNLLWSFSGRNLFLSDEEGEKVLDIENDVITIKDLYGTKYRLNSSGEEI